MATKLQKKIATVSVKIDRLFGGILRELQGMLDGAPIDEIENIISETWKKYNVPEEYKNIILQGMVQAHKLTADIDDTVAFKKFYEKSVTVDGSILSKKIQDVTRVDEIASDIKAGMKSGEGLAKLAVEFEKKGITTAELPKYIDELVKLSREAVKYTGDGDIHMEYKKVLSRAKQNILALKDTDRSTLAQGYRDIVTASKNAADNVLSATIDRAIMFKARFNAHRLAHTETARAYGNARIFEYQQDEDVWGIRWTLSGVHDKYCVCDLFADADLFNMGAGIYPKDQVPDYPAHPYCVCLLDPIYGDREPGQYDDQSGEDFFNSLDEEDRAALVGKEGSWNDIDWKDHQLPAGFNKLTEGE